MHETGTYVIQDGVLEKYSGSAAVATVPDGVKEIGEGVFMHSRTLRQVVFPSSLRHVGDYAFNDCRALEAAILPPKAETVGEAAFANCENLKTLFLPAGLRRIGYRAFYGCRSLERFRLRAAPDGVGEQAFRGCLALADPQGLVIVGGVLYDCAAGGDVTVPEGVTAVSAAGFAFARKLKRAVLPGSLRRIGSRAFLDCRELEELLLPEGLETIGNEAFWDCRSLRRVSLPKSLVRLGSDAFSGCRAMADGQGFFILDGVLHGYFGPRENVTVPEGVTRIGARAFEAGPGPLILRLPDSLESVSPAAFTGGELVLRVRRWVPGLDRALEPCRVTALSTADISAVPPGLRKALRPGYALAPEAELDSDEAMAAMDWLSRNAGSLRADAFRLPALLRFLCEYRLIPPKDADAYLEEARAGDSPEAAMLLLDYVNTLGAETVQKTRERKLAREEASAEARALRLAARSPEDGAYGLRIAADGPLESWRSRQELKVWLEVRGAKLDRAINGRTDYLVTNEPEGDSERLKRAADLGVPVLTEKELRRLADGNHGGHKGRKTP